MNDADKYIYTVSYSIPGWSNGFAYMGDHFVHAIECVKALIEKGEDNIILRVERKGGKQ